jgi:DNA polymerase-3 subunit delta'
MRFQDVMVDEELKRQLAGLVKENRISHAQLFLGQSGNHSFALAVAYAQFLSCENREEWDSCGTCASCQKYDKLSHPDLHLIFPNSTTKDIKKDSDSKQLAREFKQFVFDRNYHIGLEEWLLALGGENKQASINIRDCSNIINENSNRSYEGGYKVYILWMVERLYHSAAPKLLKTLEEPEPKSLFILIAENSDKILSTILSRTQLVKIPRMSNKMIVKGLQKEFGATEAIASDIAEISEGNYLRAKQYFNEQGELKAMLSRFELMMRSAVNLSRKANNAQIQFLEVQEMFGELIGQGRETQKNFFHFAMRMYRNILLLSTNHDTVIRSTSQERTFMERFTPYIHLKNISAILEECNKAIFHIERNGNSPLIFTDFYLNLCKHLTQKSLG